jgi:hypothetical protein
MNTTLNKPKSKQAKKFVTGSIAGAKANNAKFDNKEVPFVYRNHYVNTKTGVNGIENLIVDILQNNNAVFAKDVAASPLRNMAICQAMFISEIIASVRKQFGFDRYPDATIYTVVSVLMVKSGLVSKIALSNIEDKNRDCCRPRAKFFLIQVAA